MCVSTTNGETNSHMIQEKEPTKNEGIFATGSSAVILIIDDFGFFGQYSVSIIRCK